MLKAAANPRGMQGYAYLVANLWAANHRRVWRLAGPVILSNITTPLLGAVDTGVVGHLPDPALIGGVALGSLIFNFVFWGFGFLRMGTTGLTAQALGADRPRRAARDIPAHPGDRRRHRPVARHPAGPDSFSRTALRRRAARR